jgi:uncharacterized membrane protein YgcG
MGISFEIFSLILFTIIFSINYNRCEGKNLSIIFCSSINDCSKLNQICFNNECKCGPNYKFNSLLGICVYFKCFEDIDCQEFDKNQVCENSCVCKQKYIRNVSTKFCSEIRGTAMENVSNFKNLFTTKSKKLNFSSPYLSKDYLERCDSDSDCKNSSFGQYCLQYKCSSSLKIIEKAGGKGGGGSGGRSSGGKGGGGSGGKGGRGSGGGGSGGKYIIYPRDCNPNCVTSDEDTSSDENASIGIRIICIIFGIVILFSIIFCCCSYCVKNCENLQLNRLRSSSLQTDAFDEPPPDYDEIIKRTTYFDRVKNKY